MDYRNWVKDFKTGEEIVANAEYREAIKKTMEEKCGDAMSGLKDCVIHVESGFSRQRTGKKVVSGQCGGKGESGVLLSCNYCYQA